MSWGYDDYGYGGYPPRKSAAARRAEAAATIKAAARRGTPMSPVEITGRTIARTFWGKAWCDNLERYRDFAYRLERGRTYVRTGAVIDLQIRPGRVVAAVMGTECYRTEIDIEEVSASAWTAIQRDCAGSIGSLVDLLAGHLSETVMARLCAAGTGLFPAPRAITFSCSCPDAASMCKHVAAVMYGVGARLDAAPELLFTLRTVSADALIASVARDLPTGRGAPASARVLADDGLAALFGIDLATEPAAEPAGGAAVSAPAAKAAKAKAAAKSPLARAAKGAKAPAARAARTTATKRLAKASITTATRPATPARTQPPAPAASKARTQPPAKPPTRTATQPPARTATRPPAQPPTRAAPEPRTPVVKAAAPRAPAAPRTHASRTRSSRRVAPA